MAGTTDLYANGCLVKKEWFMETIKTMLSSGPQLHSGLGRNPIICQPGLEDKKPDFQMLGDEFRMWGAEIDNLKVQEDKAKADSGGEHPHQIDEIQVRIESARDNLIRVFYSIRSEGQANTMK